MRLVVTILLGTAILGWGYAYGFQSPSALIHALLQLQGAPVPASSAILSDHELEEINAMAPQQQAERLIERTLNHYDGAAAEIEKHAEGWIGQIHATPELESTSTTAYFSSDLRVRAAALEIWRVRDGYRKTPQTVDRLIDALRATPDKQYYYMSHLGILGNRGVEPAKVFDTLMLYTHDPDGSARAAAINGLGLLGTENTIAPLLDIFHNDTSADLRERAACNLADSGMLSREERRKAVPELIRFSQDPNPDAQTHKWVYQALREITNQNLPNDPAAWVGWSGSQNLR
jgi:HEAT repeat protein